MTKRNATLDPELPSSETEKEVSNWLNAAVDELLAETDASEIVAEVAHPLGEWTPDERKAALARLDAIRTKIGPLPGPSSLELLRADRARDDEA